jgi:hypothetical protein
VLGVVTEELDEVTDDDDVVELEELVELDEEDPEDVLFSVVAEEDEEDDPVAFVGVVSTDLVILAGSTTSLFWKASSLLLRLCITALCCTFW